MLLSGWDKRRAQIMSRAWPSLSAERLMESLSSPLMTLGAAVIFTEALFSRRRGFSKRKASRLLLTTSIWPWPLSSSRGPSKKIFSLLG